MKHLMQTIAVASALLAAPLHAQVPQTLNYQGRVAVGTPAVNFDGTGQFRFALVNTGAAETFWTNDGSNTGSPGGAPTAAVSLTVTKGLYSVGLGDTALTNMTVVPVSVFDQADVRLRVWFDDGVNGSQLLTPDQPLRSVGFAMKAASADSAEAVPAGAITGAMLADGAVGSTQIAVGTVLPRQTVAGATEMAEPNTSYAATSADLTRFELPATANVGDVVRITGVGAGGWEAGIYDLTWTARASSQNWKSVASSADGSKLVAVDGGYTSGGRIYTSTDSGETWTARETARDWTCVASSEDGSKLVAGVWPGQIYTSTDSGVSWTARENNRGWKSVASSADGNKLVAVNFGGQIYTSTDSGVTWTARETLRAWYSVASSADGDKLVAAVSGGRIYTSPDSGVTWTARESNRNWNSVASSADGSKLVAAAQSGRIYTSTDFGVNWTARESVRDWQAVASSADGSKLVAVGYTSLLNTLGGKIYTSSDSGASWTAQESDRFWNSAASSADGSKLVAVAQSARIYTYFAPSIASGAQGTTATLQFLGNGQWVAAGSAEGVVTGAAIADGSVTAADLDTGSIGLWSVNGGDVYRGSGKVGIGTTSPAAKLQVAGQGVFTPTTTDPDPGNIVGSPALHIGYFSTNDYGYINAVHSGVFPRNLILQKNGGKVGIGTATPDAPLHVVGHVSQTLTLRAYLDALNVVPNISIPNNTQFVSIHADGAIRSDQSFIVASDERIKDVESRSDGVSDLERLRSIEIMNYSYKDKVNMGGGKQKKVIAQQVEEVYPLAVNHGKGVVPDICEKASVEAGWVQLRTDLEAGERVRLITEKEERVHEVLEVKEGAFRTDGEVPEGAVFVYGREVDDFRTVDYDAISMLNVSATQELARRLETENTALKKQLAEQGEQLAKLKENDQARDAKLASIERLLREREASAVRTVSIGNENQTVTTP